MNTNRQDKQSQVSYFFKDVDSGKFLKFHEFQFFFGLTTTLLNYCTKVTTFISNSRENMIIGESKAEKIKWKPYPWQTCVYIYILS